MSTESLSRSSYQTFADLIAAINQRTDLPLRRRQDLTSALRRFCRLQHQDPGEISAESVKVRQELAQMSPRGTGLKPGSLRNLKSLVGKTLQMTGITAIPRRARYPLSLEWKPLLGAIEDQHQRHRLSRFARAMSERGVKPADVDDELMDRYREELVSKSLVTRPKQSGRETVLAWNLMRRTPAGQRLRELSVPDSRPRYARSPEAFPASFSADLESYLAQLEGDDLFDERTAPPASPDTICARRKWILCIGSALVEAGRDPHSIRSLADLVQPEAAKAALKVVWNRLGQRKTGYLHNLALLLVNLGRHWVKLPAEDLEKLRALRRAIDPGKSGGMTESNRRKLVQFADPANVRRLFRLPGRLMEEALRSDRGGVQEAVLAQTAVAIAIELKAPLRIRTLVALDVEQHIARSHSRSREVAYLMIPPGLVKNRQPLSFELPGEVLQLIDTYCVRFRPRLMTRPGSWLFPGRNGPKDRGGMSRQISEMIRKKTGLRMHAHLFRHLSGFLILRQNPGEFETVRLLLGHRSFETTSRFYSAMDQAAAFRRYDEIVSQSFDLPREHDRDAAE